MATGELAVTRMRRELEHSSVSGARSVLAYQSSWAALLRSLRALAACPLLRGSNSEAYDRNGWRLCKNVLPALQ
jgi:hypothetical protein